MQEKRKHNADLKKCIAEKVHSLKFIKNTKPGCFVTTCMTCTLHNLQYQNTTAHRVWDDGLMHGTL